MRDNGQSQGPWVTIQEASRLTGKSENAIGLMVKRKRLDQVKKANGTGRGKWLIHRDALEKILACDLMPPCDEDDPCTREEQGSLDESEAPRTARPMSPCEGAPSPGGDLVNPSIPLEHYEKKRDEWDRERERLQAGLMMYRYKFEEQERKLKLLPAPAEEVADRFLSMSREIAQKKELIIRAKSVLNNVQIAIQQKDDAVASLSAKLAEENRAKEDYRIHWELALADIRRPWWKKMLGIR
ncbi:MAG: hypothetical protein RDV48_29830 [Candidatus Eremiobacteraeota bacterium]|nr:hypothetical protein [Candidatus Eremiobacteraeota bacterium]